MKRNVDTYLDFINEDKKSKAKHQWLDTGSKPGTIEDTGRMRVGGGDDETIKYKVLKFISEHGDRGVRYTDIIKYILEIKGQGPYDHKKHRGHWATNLLGTTGYWSGGKGTGLLLKYCTKNEDNKWVIANDALSKYFMSADLSDLLDDDALSALSEIL